MGVMTTRKVYQNRINLTSGLIGGLDASTIAWINAVNALAGSFVVSSARQTLANNLITTIKGITNVGPNINSHLLRMWILAFADENVNETKVDICNLQTWTQVGTGTLDANGWTGDGSSGYLDMNVNLSSGGGGVFTLNSASYGTYILNSRTSTNNTCSIGVNDATASTLLRPAVAGGWGGYINDNTGNATATGLQAQGNWIRFRHTSSGVNTHKNSALVDAGSATSTNPPAANAFIGARNNDGTPTDFSTDSIASVFLGSNLTSDASAISLANAINACMTSLGKNVY